MQARREARGARGGNHTLHKRIVLVIGNRQVIGAPLDVHAAVSLGGRRAHGIVHGRTLGAGALNRRGAALPRQPTRGRHDVRGSVALDDADVCGGVGRHAAERHVAHGLRGHAQRRVAALGLHARVGGLAVKRCRERAVARRRLDDGARVAVGV